VTEKNTINPSIKEAAKALGVTQGGISNYFARKTSKPYKERYVIKKLGVK